MLFLVVFLYYPKIFLSYFTSFTSNIISFPSLFSLLELFICFLNLYPGLHYFSSISSSSFPSSSSSPSFVSSSFTITGSRISSSSLFGFWFLLYGFISSLHFTVLYLSFTAYALLSYSLSLFIFLFNSPFYALFTFSSSSSSNVDF